MPISPIPRSLLPHTATLKKPDWLDAREGKRTPTIQLNYIRFETARKNALTSLGEQRNDLGVLFFDMQNSLPDREPRSPLTIKLFLTDGRLRSARLLRNIRFTETRIITRWL